MPRSVAFAAYVLACVMALAGSVVAGAIHAATERGTTTTTAGLAAPEDRDVGPGAFAASLGAPNAPSSP